MKWNKKAPTKSLNNSRYINVICRMFGCSKMFLLNIWQIFWGILSIRCHAAWKLPHLTNRKLDFQTQDRRERTRITGGLNPSSAYMSGFNVCYSLPISNSSAKTGRIFVGNENGKTVIFVIFLPFFAYFKLRQGQV